MMDHSMGELAHHHQQQLYDHKGTTSIALSLFHTHTQDPEQPGRHDGCHWSRWDQL